VHLVAVASPAGGPEETFRIAGLVNPAITVPAGARVSIQMINADPDTAHGLVITASQNISSPMPMMTSQPAFTGSALWFLGNPTNAGMHTATLNFTGTTPGPYHYLCPVPWPRPGRHDRDLHRQQLELMTSKGRLAQNRRTGRAVLVSHVT
jgi:rusticyanin